MRTRTGRPRQAEVTARWLRLLVVFLIPALIAFSVAAPVASAGLSPTLSKPGSVDLVVPEDGSAANEQQFEEYAERLLDDPMGHVLAELASALRGTRASDGTDPGNVSVEWFDLNSLPRDIYNDVIQNQFKESNARLMRDFEPGKRYNIKWKTIAYAGNEQLYKRLGADPSHELFQVSNYNAPGFKGMHSEEIPLGILRNAIAVALIYSGRRQSGVKAFADAGKAIQQSALGLASERSPCADRCDPQTLMFRVRMAIINYGLTSEEHAAATAAILGIISKAEIMLKHEWQNAREQQRKNTVDAAEQTIKTDMGLPAGTRTGAQPQSTTRCGPQAAGQPGSGNSQDMALMAFSSGGPCGEGEGAPGGLVEALTSGNLGGVDFSTLQMRYMSDSPGSTGLQYSFSGQADTSATPQDIGSALNVLTDNAADLRTWLVLNPDEFWVNLNPSEPDRIIGSQLGETNAGRELLDADFQLKRSSATLMNPNTKLGAQYWRDLAGSSSSVCYGSRMWIVPGQVQVREDGGSLYILNAQLAVKAVPDHVADMPASCHYDAQTDARGQRLDRTMIVPLLTKMVNTAPEYAPIRRAFMARIVAQWIRGRHASGQRTSFDSLIDSGNIGPAKLQDGWQPQQVFNAYVKSLKDGEFTYNTTIRQGRATYIQKITIGGVDFTNLNLTAVSAAKMNQHYPQLAQIMNSSVSQLTSSDGTLWLGDTIAPPTGSPRPKVTDPVRSLANGRTGILILVLAGLGVVIFGIRRRSGRGPQAT
jgi:hypothetical protein